MMKPLSVTGISVDQIEEEKDILFFFYKTVYFLRIPVLTLRISSEVPSRQLYSQQRWFLGAKLFYKLRFSVTSPIWRRRLDF